MGLGLPQARVYIPDDRFDWLCDLYKPKSKAPAYLEARPPPALWSGLSHSAARLHGRWWTLLGW